MSDVNDLKTHPERIGDYLLLEKLGAGGVGTVFKAWHDRLDQMVALKVLSEESLKSDEMVQRFLREVRASAQLQHENIVETKDAGEVDGTHFLSMEYVLGKNLHDLIEERGPLPFATAFEYILQAARGLRYAHHRKIIHRDIKPANLMLDDEGTIKILDMGLARINDPGRSEVNLTQAHTVMGSAAYMAPEQADQLGEADARSDIYSLGCTLYYLLTGEDAFQGESFFKVVMAHRDQPIPSLQEDIPSIPPTFDWIFQLMMKKDPQERYQSMDELVQDLKNTLSEYEQAMRAPFAATTDISGEETVDDAPPEPVSQKEAMSSLGSMRIFAQSLAEIGLVAVSDFQKVLERLPKEQWPEDPKIMADLLAREHLITPFQKAVITSGTPQDLLFDQYLIHDKMMEGPWAVRYYARNPATGEKVTIKCLSSELASGEELPRLEESIARAQKFEHPDVVPILASGVRDGRLFYVTPFYGGRDLSRHLRQYGLLTPEKATDLIWQLADLLAVAKKQGLLHLGLKPTQILLLDDGSIKLTDLGLERFNRLSSKRDTQAHDLSSSGTLSTVLRTVDCASAEFLINPEKADYRSDIYSLGCLLFFMLTGMPLYNRPSPQATILAHQKEPIPILSELCATATQGLQDAFEKMVAKKRKDRYRSYEELQNAFRTFSPLAKSKPPKPVAAKSPEQASADKNGGKTTAKPKKAKKTTKAAKAGKTKPSKADESLVPMVVLLTVVLAVVVGAWIFLM